MTISRTYELPEPTTQSRRGTFAVWNTGHHIENDGHLNNDGDVLLNYSRGNIIIETHNNDVLALNYHEAHRVGLALLAAVEQTKTIKEDNS